MAYLFYLFCIPAHTADTASAVKTLLSQPEALLDLADVLEEFLVWVNLSKKLLNSIH